MWTLGWTPPPWRPLLPPSRPFCLVESTFRRMLAELGNCGSLLLLLSLFDVPCDAGRVR
jgi:hypothetical protein